MIVALAVALVLTVFGLILRRMEFYAEASNLLGIATGILLILFGIISVVIIEETYDETTKKTSSRCSRPSAG